MSASVATEDGVSERGRLLDNMVLFARLLRVGDANPAPSQIAAWVAALGHVDLTSKSQTKEAARAVLISHVSELEWFDAAFELFWQARETTELEQLELGLILSQQSQSRLLGGADEDGMADSSETEPKLTWSARESLALKPFTELDHLERQEVERLIATMSWSPPPVKTRRTLKSQRGTTVDLRRSFRRSLRHGGELIELARQRPRFSPRPLIALCDISGSMEPYSRLLLHFLYALRHRQGVGAQFEAFAFGTRLTRLSPDLSNRNIDNALSSAVERVNDWGSGTRTAESLRDFHQDWAPRVLGRGAIAIIISDGWDRGDPEQLAREMARLSRVCDRVIWLNPLLGNVDYEPLTRGLVAALPHVDDFLPVHNLRSLEQLSSVLRSSTDSTRVA